MPELICHPDTPCTIVTKLTVELGEVVDGQVLLTYTLEGDIAALALPVSAPLVHTDGLWQHTCFEAFVRDGASSSYKEYNFSPSGAWAAYHFTAYREGMMPLSLEELQTSFKYSSTKLQLKAKLPVPPGAVLALSAVIESAHGPKSYWALKHPPGKPDFHHQDGFIYNTNEHKL